jgi:hypothetical protein
MLVACIQRQCTTAIRYAVRHQKPLHCGGRCGGPSPGDVSSRRCSTDTAWRNGLCWQRASSVGSSDSRIQHLMEAGDWRGRGGNPASFVLQQLDWAILWIHGWICLRVWGNQMEHTEASSYSREGQEERIVLLIYLWDPHILEQPNHAPSTRT